MERNLKKIGLVNLVVLLMTGLAGTFLARYANTLAGQTGMVFLGLGFLATAVSYFQMRLEERERLERLEFEEVNKAPGSASLFNTTDAEVFPARHAREQFERFFVPGFTIVLFILQAAGAYWLWTKLSKVIPSALHQPTVAMSLFGLFALILFLLGKYSVGIARLDATRLIRPGASYLLLGAYICFAVTASIAAVQMGFPKVDLYAARGIAILLCLTAAETLINLILEIYRPRVKGKVGRLLYDSRLVGLLAEPEGLVTTAAQALDYQFGFKVSDTWFYRFLEKALVWLILLQLAVLFFSTSFVFISPGEQGLLERFGSPVANRAVLEPGLHFKLPWPFDQVYRFRTREIQSFNVGFVPEAEEEHGKETTVLWTGKHAKEESNLLVASREERSSASTNNAAGERGIPVDLLNVSVPVQFQIDDLRAWAYNHTDAAKLLEKVATREVVRYLVSVDLFEIMSSGRSKTAEDLRQRIQAQADNFKLGVKIIFVGLQDIHPPVKVAPAFENLVAARQENEAKLHEARGYATKTVTLATSSAIKQVRDAEAESHRTVAGSRAQASQFTNQIVAYNASPRVFLERAYLQALEHGSTNARKYILATTNTQDILQMNLEDKIRSDLIGDLGLPAAKK